MKTLSQHISEKLIINKNYKNVDDIETMFDNVEFKQQKISKDFLQIRIYLA